MTPETQKEISIIDKYFSEPTTQVIIQETEEIRKKAYNAKQEFYKKYKWILILLYLVILVCLYGWISYFWTSNDFYKSVLFILLAPWGAFILLAKSKQSTILQSKQVTTKLFDNFIKFILPWSQFNETSSLYQWNPIDSCLFISDQEENSRLNTVRINKNICNSILIPLIYTQANQVSVQLEGVEVTITQHKWSKNHNISWLNRNNDSHSTLTIWWVWIFGNSWSQNNTMWSNQTTITDMGMLYKIIFNNPKHLIPQSVKIITNNDSRFKEKDNIVSLENQEFEKYFDVYSIDQLEARVLLTPNVMDKLTQFIKTTWSSYSFNFIGNIFYIKHTLSNTSTEWDLKFQVSGIDMSALSKIWKSSSIINIDRDNSIEKNKEIYNKFHSEMANIQQLVDALNVDYFNKLS